MIAAMLAAVALLTDSSSALQTKPAGATTPTVSVTSTVSPATVQAKAKPNDAGDPMAIVCHQEPVLGSRLSVKRCSTRGEEAMRKFDARQELERMQGDTYRH